MSNFSSIYRAEQLEALQSEDFDLLVIGGGVTGCGIALDAASRGMKTALVEMGDFASGTSSKSTKLIHGGLRYLKQFEIALVHETGRERAIVHRLAPHLVLPEKMLLPLVKGGTYSKWTASMGILVYDLLAGVAKEDRRKMLSKEKTLATEPLLDPSRLLGSVLYAEYRTDDARLTIELIKRAASFGALAANYCKVTDFEYNAQGKIVATHCVDVDTARRITIKAKQVVSAAGPWVDHLRALDHSKKGKQLHLTKGVHIVFPHEKFPLRHAVYFDASAGRMVFAIPRGKTTYVGTTDTNYKGSLERVLAEKEDVHYLLQAIKYAFPVVHLSVNDIRSSWAGLRPLIHEEGKSPSELSRKDEIFESSSGLISIAGGKLTGYRMMAKRVVDKVLQKGGLPFGKCKTRKIPLVENALRNSKEVRGYIASLGNSFADIGLTPYHAWYLVTTYGKQSDLILSKMKQLGVGEGALIRAELWFAVHYEMAHSLADFFSRRTGRLYFDMESVGKWRELIGQDMKMYLNWNQTRLQKEIEKLDGLIGDACCF